MKIYFISLVQRGIINNRGKQYCCQLNSYSEFVQNFITFFFPSSNKRYAISNNIRNNQLPLQGVSPSWTAAANACSAVQPRSVSLA